MSDKEAYYACVDVEKQMETLTREKVKLEEIM